MIVFTAHLRHASCTTDPCDRITTGSVGIQVRFAFSAEWDGLGKTAVFRGSGKSIDVLLTGDDCCIPPEVLTQPGDILSIGVYGTDGSGELAIPTVYADAGRIHRGAEPSGIEPTPETASLVEQLLAAAQAARDAADEAQEIAQSVRDDADAGAFDGEDGTDGASAYQIAVAHGYVGTEEEWLASLHGKDGEASIAKTVSGEILAIEDGTEDKPKALSVEIPYQADGISGFTMRFRRRNMLDLTGTITSAGMTYTPQSDGTLEINGTATGNSRYGAFGSTSYISPNNTYNLPAGTYTVFAQWTDTEAFSAGWHVYVGTSSTKIGDFSSSGAAVISNAISQSGRVACQFSGTSFDHHKPSKLFMGVGARTVEEWDAPATTRYELAVDIGQTVYGGTADLTDGVFYSRYASDGTELAEPVEIPIEAELPTLYEGANTIWASVIGSVVTMTYGKAVKDYVDEQTDAIQTEIDTLDATTQDQLTGEFSSLGMFAKIGIIGDSYAQGNIHYSDATVVCKPLSWGKHLERDLGVAVTLYTHGGYSTRDWLTDATCGLPKLEADASTSPCDLYWCGLGINDSAYYDDHPDYLGSITDISSHVSGDPWAATFYGNMGQIVERIQAAAPSAKLVIASFVGYRPKAQTAADVALNAALETIAGYYSLPYIDLRDDPFYMSDFYTAQIYGKHPTAIGYAGMAKANERLFARAAVEYRSYFMDYHNSTAFPTGDGGAVSSVNGKTGAVVLDATDVGAGTYSKPSGGIPASDLASAVQTSLGKADTAVQTETDPTVPAWAKAASKPSYTASEVGAVALSQGVSHAGEFVVVGSDGNITTVTMTAWAGGSY